VVCHEVLKHRLLKKMVSYIEFEADLRALLCQILLSYSIESSFFITVVVLFCLVLLI